VIERNRVWDHNKTGIGLVPFLEEDPNDVLPSKEDWELLCADSKLLLPEVPEGALLWDSQENVVRGNLLEDNRIADLAVGSAGTNLWELGNCFEDNSHTSAAPTNLVALSPCGNLDPTGDWLTGDLVVINWLVEAETAPPSVDWKTAPLPELPVLENMPDAATAPAVPASPVPPVVDLESIMVPAKID